MKIAIGCLLLAALAVAVFPQQARTTRKKNQFNEPKLGLVKFVARREVRVFVFEGTVKNISDSPLAGIKVYFEFLESDNKMIGRRSIVVSEEVIEPGEECEFLAETQSIPRVISVRIDTFDKQGRPVRVDKPGPYFID